MTDLFTSTTGAGLFSGVKKAIFGAFFGLLMVPGSVALLSWNEYRTIKNTHGLNEGAELVQTVDDPSVASPSLAGTLIHLTGKADTQEQLRDETFGVQEQAIRLTRKVEMFQWVEDKDTEKRGNRKKTTYSYKKKWESGREDHLNFDQPTGHENPQPKFSAVTLEANRVNLGQYILNKNLKGSIRSKELVGWTDELFDALPEEIRDRSKLAGEHLYWSKEGDPSPESPQIGDQRILFKVVRPTQVSLVSAVKDNAPEQLKPYTTSNGVDLERLYVGEFSAAEVFEKMQEENAMWAWILRAGGFFISFLGFTMILGVLGAFTNWIPVIGSMTRTIFAFVSFLLAVVLTTLTIAFAWIAVRPLLAIPLIGVGVVAAVMAWRSSSKNQTPAQNFATAGETPVMLTPNDVVK